MVSTPPLPRTVPDGPEELTAAWMTRALREGGTLADGSVSQLTVEGLGVGKGMAGRVVRVRLSYDRDDASLPATLIAKFPAGPGPTRALADLLNLYERELRFYEEFASRAIVPTPRVYHGAQDDGRFVLLMEDVADTAEGDLLRGCSLDDARAIVERLASMHAAWWGAPDLSACTWLPAPSSSAVIEFTLRSGPGAWKEFDRRFGRHMPRSIRSLGARMSRDRRVVDALSQPPWTLVHGDMRANNVLFAARGAREPRSFIDWQTAVRGRGPIDLAALFVSSLQPADRRVAEFELLPLYHQLLVERGVRDYSFEVCWRDYRLAVVNQFSQVVVLSSMLQVEERLEDGVGAVTGGRLVAALLDLELGDLLPRESGIRHWLSRLGKPGRGSLTGT